jgi:hypothetical protein
MKFSDQKLNGLFYINYSYLFFRINDRVKSFRMCTDLENQVSSSPYKKKLKFRF